MSQISSTQNPAIKQIRSLAEKKFRQETGLFVAEGSKVLERARAMGWTPEMLVSTAPAEPWGNARLLEVTPAVMASLSTQSNPPALLGVFRQSWCERIEPQGLWLALEDARDPGNLGTIIRTADAAGARGVILVGQSCDPWSSTCLRATMGSIFAMPLVRLTTDALVELCKTWPGESVGADIQGTEDYRRAYEETALIIMGSEGTGLSEPVAHACSALARIPMSDGPQSLNIAVASALMLFEVRRHTAMPAFKPS